MTMKRNTIYRILYIILFLVASVPLACEYVMEGGDVLIWLARIEEIVRGLKFGELIFFPSVELTVAKGGQYSALSSNLWLLFPAMVRLLGGTITFAYRSYLLLLNLMALFAGKKLFECIFEDKRTAFIGVLLYMTSPYRIYLCYDKGSMGMMAAWTLIPLALWGMLRIFQKKADWKCLAITTVTFAGIGYADGMLMLLTAGIGLLGVVWYRKIMGLLPLVVGAVLYLPGMIYPVRYLVKGGMEVWSLPLTSISPKGYTIGQFFSSWVYKEDCPGFGLGLMVALTVLLWLAFVEGHLQILKKYGFFVVATVLFMCMALKIFPWDVVQRIAPIFLRLVPLMETPGVCFGFATLTACVLGSYGVECVAKQESVFVRIGIPVMVIIAAVGIAMYTCNTLVYNRFPMYLLDVLP